MCRGARNLHDGEEMFERDVEGRDYDPEDQLIGDYSDPNPGGDDDDDDGSDGEGSDAEEVGRPAVSVDQVHLNMAKVMCLTEMSFAFLEDLGRILCPSLTLDFETVRRDCLKVYAEEKAKLKEVLNKMDGSIAISVDILSNYKPSGNIDDYMCLSAHFIDDDWKLQKWVIRFQEHMKNYRSDFIDTAILKSLKDWNIEGKVSNLTSRNSDVRDEVSDVIKGQLAEKRSLPLGSRLFSVGCVAEMFSLMAEDAFNEISKIIDKIKLLSWSKSKCMWPITNFKLKDALDLQAMGEFNFEGVMLDRYEVPSASEWEKVKVVHRLVESAFDVSKLVFETNYPTANKFLYNLQELRAILVQESASSNPFSCVARIMLQRLEDYLKGNFLLLAIASVLDPRFKMQYIEYMPSKFNDLEEIFRSGPILEAIRGLYADYANHVIEKENSRGASDEENSQTEAGMRFEYSQSVEIENQAQKSDLDAYLEEPVEPWRDDFDTLEWWKSEASKYPVVAKMARDILAIPLSVATSDDAYYYIENRPPNEEVISAGTKLMNALMCCRSWYPPKEEPDLEL